MATFTPADVADRVEHGAENTCRRFRIVRFYHPSLNRRPRRIGINGLTEAEAQAHCHNPATRKEGQYFDGYESY